MNTLFFRTCLCTTLLVAMLLSNAQQTYPKGIYNSYEAFKAQQPTDTLTPFVAKTRPGSNAYRFVISNTQTRLKRNFAISDGEHLFIRIKEARKRFSGKDKKQIKDDGNFCVKVIQMGPRYLYFEDYFTSSGALFLGGAIAGASSRRLKGIVYDLQTHEFDLFKNAKDFAAFIKTKHPEYRSKLPKPKPKKNGKKGRTKTIEDLELIRKLISQINANSNP